MAIHLDMNEWLICFRGSLDKMLFPVISDRFTEKLWFVETRSTSKGFHGIDLNANYFFFSPCLMFMITETNDHGQAVSMK